MKTVLFPVVFMVLYGSSAFAQNQDIEYKKFEQVEITYPYIGRILITGNDEIRQTLIDNLGSEALADSVMLYSNELAWPDQLNAESKRKQYKDLLPDLKCYKIAESGDVCILGVPAKQSKTLVKTFNIQTDFFIPIDCQSVTASK